MKIQYLAVIFILIIMPLMIVFSEYISTEIESIQIETEYDARLLDATYDAVKAYQLNTINNSVSDRPYSKVEDIEAAVNTFYNSLVTSFGYSGYDSSVMDDYVPAVVFCLYDGYYLYSPLNNTLTGVTLTEEDENGDTVSAIDEDYEDDTIINGLGNYVYYSCRYYVKGNIDVVITYTLDNYITVEGYINDDEYVYKSGYLVDGIEGSGNTSTDDDGNTIYSTYTYDGVSFTSNLTYPLTEMLGTNEYYYTKIDGTKFYWEDADGNGNASKGDYIFYINTSGEKTKQVTYTSDNKELFMLYYKAIKQNKDAYVYYRDAYIFTDWVDENLSGLTYENAVDSEGNSILDLNDYNLDTPIFVFSDESEYYIQNSNSNFNEHRTQIIKYVIKTNLATSISAYGNYVGDSSITYIMPEISDTDWELITNNVCVATFMQGMSTGSTVYNSYAVVANTLTNEYVDENDIYIIGTENDLNQYYKANDSALIDGLKNGTIELKYYGRNGRLKINFERRVYTADGSTTYYYPLQYLGYLESDAIILGSYTSIVGSSSVTSISTTDMYRYMSGLSSSTYVTKLKTAYYTALGRERVQSYRVQNGLEEETLDLGNGEILEDNVYYLKNYD